VSFCFFSNELPRSQSDFPCAFSSSVLPHCRSWDSCLCLCCCFFSFSCSLHLLCGQLLLVSLDQSERWRSTLGNDLEIFRRGFMSVDVASAHSSLERIESNRTGEESTPPPNHGRGGLLMPHKLRKHRHRSFSTFPPDNCVPNMRWLAFPTAGSRRIRRRFYSFRRSFDFGFGFLLPLWNPVAFVYFLLVLVFALTDEPFR
jgi:hypothetical protein